MADQWKVVEETPLNPEQIQQDPVAVPEWNVVEEVPLDLYAGDQNQGFIDRANQLFQEQLQPKEGFWPSFGKGLVRELPTMGMLAGGAVGAGAGGLGTAATLGAGSPMIPVLGVAGAGLGAGAGESLKQLIEQWTGISEPLGVEESLKRQGQAILHGAGGQMMGEGVAKAVAPAVPIVADVFKEAAKAYGLPQMAIKSRPWIEFITDRFFGSRLMNDSYRKKFYDWALKERDSFTRDFLGGRVPEPESIGSEWGSTFRNIAEEHKKLYETFGSSTVIKEGGETSTPLIPMDKSASIAHKIQSTATGNDKEWIEKIINQRNLTPTEINKMLGGKRFGLSPEARTMIKDSVIEDLNAYDNLHETYLSAMKTAADDAYKELLNKWASNPSFNRVMREFAPQMEYAGIGGSQFLAPRPGEVIDKFFRSGDISGQMAIKEIMPEKLWNMGLARYLDDELKLAMDESLTNFYPRRWAERWREIGPRIEKFSPETHERIDQWTKMIMRGENVLDKAPKVGSFLEGIEKAGKSTSGTTAAAGGIGFFSGGPAGAAASVAVANSFPMMMSHKFLGPAGKSLIRDYSKLYGTAAATGTMQGMEYADEPRKQ